MTMPAYDRRRDGDVFAWILKAAEQVRRERKAEQFTARLTRPLKPWPVRPDEK